VHEDTRNAYVILVVKAHGNIGLQLGGGGGINWLWRCELAQNKGFCCGIGSCPVERFVISSV
jgi:hypothetical protein